MKRTTVYFPEEMKAAIERESARRDVTEAEVIRSAVEEMLDSQPARMRVFPVFPDGLGEAMADRIDEHPARPVVSGQTDP